MPRASVVCGVACPTTLISHPGHPYKEHPVRSLPVGCSAEAGPCPLLGKAAWPGLLRCPLEPNKRTSQQVRRMLPIPLKSDISLRIVIASNVR